MILGRHPILLTAAFGALVNLAVYMAQVFGWLAISPTDLATLVTLLNVAFAAVIAVVANVAVTPISDPRLPDGTQVNSGTSTVTSNR